MKVRWKRTSACAVMKQGLMMSCPPDYPWGKLLYESYHNKL